MLCSKELELVPMKNHCTKTYQPVKTTGLTPFHEVRPKALDTQWTIQLSSNQTSAFSLRFTQAHRSYSQSHLG